MADLSLAGVSKRFGTVQAVDGLSLDIASGEFVVLLGPSGAGKTTTLRLVAGLEQADEGTITLADRDVTDLPPRDRDIAMVFQSYALYPHMSVRQNLAYGLKVRRTSAAPVGRNGERSGNARLSNTERCG